MKKNRLCFSSFTKN